ncbi:hypothetical protein BDQ17DRAFT_1542199 [Cyathus striatus]|nr:hypothetical protein BDQ17DRAFT_1542199 [Cyathus striatus]
MEIQRQDVIVIGGGVSGCATVLSLLKYGKKLKCVLVDESDPSQFKIGESLPAEAGQILGQLHPKLPEYLRDQVASGIHLQCTGNASAWASPEVEERHSILNPFGHGLHLNRAVFDKLIKDMIIPCEDHPGSDVMTIQGKFIKVEKHPSGDWLVEVNVDSEIRILRATWLVDATGRKASIAMKARNDAGAKSITSDQLLAFYTLFKGPEFLDSEEGDNDNRTLIEATPDGWFYSSLVGRSPSTRIVVFHTTPSHAVAKQARKRDDFMNLLGATAIQIPRIIEEHDYTMLPGYPKCTAAGSSHLDRVCNVDEHWVAVGDAAAAFDPLSSQGMITGLEMGLYLGAILGQHLQGEIDPQAMELTWEEMYVALRADYEKNRSYYYSIVKRFAGEEFWEKVNSIAKG